MATALWSGVQALNAQARADYARAATVLQGPSQTRLVPRQGGRLPQSLYVDMRRAGWPVSPMLEGRLRFAGDPPLTLRILGVEPLTLPQGSAVAGTPIDAFDVTAFIGRPGETWVGEDTLARLQARPGDTPATLEGELLPPLRLQQRLPPGVLVTDIGQAQRLLHAQGAVSRFLLPADLANLATALPAAWSAILAPAPADDERDLRRLTDSFHLNLSALGMLSFIVGLFIVQSAIGLALEQRRPLLRTLRACGVALRVLLAALLVELAGFALLGGVLGVASGYGMAGVLLGNVAASLRGLYGADVATQLGLPWQWWLGGLAMALSGALVAGAGSLARAARLPLLAIARPQAWRAAHARGLRRQAVLAALLGLLAVACWQWGRGLSAAFALQAAMLLCAAMLLPVLLDGALAVSARYCRTPLSSWFVADARQQLPALGLALMALLLALAASTAVGSMTGGFRATFTGWLNQRLSADLYVTPRDTAQGLQAADWLSTLAGTRAVLPQWRYEMRLQGWPVDVQGVVDHARTRAEWPLLAQRPGAWDDLAQGRGVMISEQMSRQLQLALGDTLAFDARDMSGGTAAPGLPVVGLFADYGNGRGHVLMQAELLRRHWPQALLRSLHVYADGAAPIALLQSRIDARYGDTGMQVVDQASLRRWSTKVFDRTFMATTALNTLTLGVAGIALFVGLLALAENRLSQLAPLWALGVPRARLAALSLGQALMLSSLTVLLAIPLGILLAWCLVAIVNVQAFGWRLPLQVFPGQLLRLAGLGVLTGMLAAAGPAWRLWRRQPADLLRQFTNET